MAEERIQIRIPSAREKLKVSFPQDPRGDFRLVFKSKSFKLQKAYLRLQSNYFKKKCTPDIEILEVKEEFNIGQKVAEQEFFESVISCFYGNRITVPRNQILNYYPIIRFLEVDCLLTELRRDMVQNVEYYDLFTLMKLGHRYSEEELFQTCLIQLEKEGFQQIKYSLSEFLSCDLQLFKLVIKTHNRKKNVDFKGLQYRQIDDLIKQYCQANGFSQQKYHEYKFELIDKTKLTAQEYKEIFMDELAKNRQSMIMFKGESSVKYGANGSDPQIGRANPLYESYIDPNNTGAPQNDLSIEMQNIYQKKLNEQLEQQKSHLASQLKKLKQINLSNQETHVALVKQFNDLKQKVRNKQKEQKEMKTTISRFQKKIQSMETDLGDKDRLLKTLQSKFLKLSQIISTQQFSRVESNENTFAESTIIPANFLGDIMKEKSHKYHSETTKHLSPSMAKKQQQKILESMDDEQLEEKYSSRISFSHDPISIPKIHIPKIVQFLGTDGFSKKNCKLVYRRSDKHPQYGAAEDIRERGPLFLTIKTGTGQIIGGFISISIPNDATDYLEDGHAYIFSLTRGKKFNVKESSKSQAIMISEHFLICFGNDLMISKDCLNEESNCDWSSSYEKGLSNENGPKWFAGGHEFMIKDLEFFEVEEGDMQMVL